MWNSEDELHDFVGKIYEASYCPEKWADVLGIVAEATHADSAFLIYRDSTRPQTNIFSHYGISKEWLNLYSNHFVQLNPYAQLFSGSVPVGTVVADHQITPDRQELAKLCGEFYSRVMVPYDQYHVGGATLLDDGERSLVVAVQRQKSDSPYQDSDLVRLQMIAPHIERAVRIHSEFSQLRHRRQMFHMVLDQMVVGLMLLDSAGKLIYVNPLAKQIARQHSAIEISGVRLRATGQEDDNKFQTLIRDCLSAKAHDSSTGGVLGLRHFQSDLPLSVLVTPARQLDGLSKPEIGQEAVAIFISDPSSRHPISPEALEMAYGLTRREAEVAVALANGQKIADIAEAAGTTLNTVRTQLKSIFNKTNTNRQAQLIKLLLTGPFNIRPS